MSDKKKPFYRFKVHSDASDLSNNEVSVKDIWGGFKEQTTAHGIPHIDKAKGGCKITFWLIITLACVGLLGWQLSQIILVFIDWRVDVVIALAHSRMLQFPAVTICNLNPIKYSRLNYSTELEEFVNSNSRRRRSDLSDDDNHALSRTRRSTSESDEAYEILAGIEEGTKQLMGYTIDEFILDCQYAGVDCHMDEFSSYFDPTYGNCYIFNSGWDSSIDLEFSKRAGRRHGMKFVLNIKQDEYVEEFSQGAGARILINAQQRMPFPSDEGILTTPGQITSIGMRQVQISRLGEPFGNCTDRNKTKIEWNVYEEFYNVRYTSNACFKTCYQKYVIRQCGCADPQYPTYGVAFGRSSPAPICSSSDSEQSRCKERISQRYQDNDLKCYCPTRCIETTYNFEVSNVQWPSDIHMPSVIETYSDVAPEIANANDSIVALQQNLLKVEVYFQEFNFETLTERQQYRPFNFLSDIGGILGLWLGLSLLSVFEFFELGFDLCIYLCLKCCKKKGGKPESPPPPYTSSDSQGRHSQTVGLGESSNGTSSAGTTRNGKIKTTNVLGFV